MLGPGRNLPHDVVFNAQDYYYGNYGSGGGTEDESGTETPPLWRPSPQSSPPPRQEVNYLCLSPASKAQAIARGQRELMEMVSRIPESCYELSLKDLVEHPLVVEAKPQGNSKESFRREVGKKRNDERKIQRIRSGRYENNNGGLFLKMVFPVSWGAKKRNKKKNDPSSNNRSNSMVSPKPAEAAVAEVAKGVDKEWWTKGSSASSGSESVRSSTRSGSTKSTGSSSSSSRNSNSNSSRHQQGGGCWCFFRSRKSNRS